MKEEEEEIIEEYLDECFETEEVSSVSFVDTTVSPSIRTSFTIKEINVKKEYNEEYEYYEIPDAILDHQYMIPKVTFDGNYSSDDRNYQTDDDASDVKFLITNKEKPKKHKIRQLTGKAACKYCDTVFKSKDSLKMHSCEYLQCDPKNYICRICKKELSKKTFSNHLHETLDCQYCDKQFVNPRNMQKHVEKFHKGEEVLAPKPPKRKVFENFENRDEVPESVLDEATGLMVTEKKPRKKYPRKTGRFECGKLKAVIDSSRIINTKIFL